MLPNNVGNLPEEGVNLPGVYQNRMKALLGEEYQAFLLSFSQQRFYGLRTNRLKCGNNLQQFPIALQRVPWIDNGWYYAGNEKPAKHPYYYAGLYYLQEPSAMTPANRLPIVPGDKVLDLCAAPGGKSTELGAKLSGEGLLVTNDISHSRAQALLKNVELFGIKNACVISEAPYKLAERFPQFFNKILIDAPCSGEGMFRKDAGVKNRWTEKSNEEFAGLQREIMTQAVKMLAPEGMLMYSTCTFSPKEDEETVAFILSLDPSLRLVEMEGYEGFTPGLSTYADQIDVKKVVRIYPHKMDGEGHFLALFQKTGGAEGSFLPYQNKTKKKEVTDCTEFWDFLAHTKLSLDKDRIEIRQNKLYYLPEGLPDVSGLRILRLGLLLGEMKTKRFEPSQALAMALSADEFDNVLSFPSEDERVIRYLKGETLEVSPDEAKDGTVLICVDGFPLGFARKKGDTLKNRYLSGWRYQ